MSDACPLCGGQVSRCVELGLKELHYFTSCCWIPLDVVENWDVIEGLPAELREKAIADAQAAHGKMMEQERLLHEEWHREEARLDELFPNRHELMKT